MKNNFAFIDGNNLYLGMKSKNWGIDYKKFRVYLRDKYNVERAYWFIGYIPKNQDIYNSLQKAGYILVFKPTIPDGKGETKGNCDSELVLQAMIDRDEYDKAVIVSGDGDFQCLVKYLKKLGKVNVVMAPTRKFCSSLLTSITGSDMRFVEDLQQKLEYKKVR